MFSTYGHRLASILQKTIDDFCYGSLPQNYDLEIDGLVYIGEIGSHQQAVVKLSRNLRSSGTIESSDGADSNGTEESNGIKTDHFGKRSSKCQGLAKPFLNGQTSDSRIVSGQTNGRITTSEKGEITRKDSDSKCFTESRLGTTSSGIPAELVTTVIAMEEETVKSLKAEPDEVYRCCSSTWVGFRSYESHFATKHFRYPCPLCNQSFTSRNNMRRHVNCNHGEKRRFECTICEKLFTRPDIVKEHKLTHTKSYRDNKCSMCHFISNKKTTLLIHLKKCLKYDNIDQDIFESSTLPTDFSRFNQSK